MDVSVKCTSDHDHCTDICSQPSTEQIISLLNISLLKVNFTISDVIFLIVESFYSARTTLTS